MIKRQLGKSGIAVSALGLGCMALGGPWLRLHETILAPGCGGRGEVSAGAETLKKPGGRVNQYWEYKPD